MSDENSESKESGRLRSWAKKILGDGDGDRSIDAKEMLGAILETGDKAKTEIVKLVAREVRVYLEALDLHNDLHQLLSNYSLEVKASFHLKPLQPAEKIAPSESPDEQQAEQQ